MFGFGGPVKNKADIPAGARNRIRSMNIGTYILCILSFIIIVGVSTLEQVRNIDYDHAQLIESHQRVYESHYRNYLDSKLDVVRKAVKQGYIAAEEQGADIACEIVSEVSYAYPNEDELREDLDNLNSPETTKLTEIIADSVTGRYIMDIKNDNNDPFIATRGSIVSDLSFNCSAVGRTRSFEQEITMHFNKSVAKNALDNIGNQASDRNIWIFLQVPDYEPFYKDLRDLEVINERVLEGLYYKYNGNIEIFQYPEYIYTNYIYRKKDIVNRPLVDPKGIRRDESQVLIINNGFNVYDIIQNTELKDEIAALDIAIRDEEIRRDNFIESQQLTMEKNKSLALLRFFLLSGAALMLVVFMAEYNNRKLRSVQSENTTEPFNDDV